MFKKFFNVSLLTVSVFSLAMTANAGRDQGAAGVPDVTYTAYVKLSNTPGQVGSLYVVNNNTGDVVPSTSGCQAIGGLGTHPDGKRSTKTPAGTHSVKTTNPNLKYPDSRSGWINGVDATVFKQPLGGRYWVAIHEGNLSSNSHGCVRTSAHCAAKVRELAEESKSSRGRYTMKIKISY